MSTLQRYDSAGYAIPFVGDDDIEECVAALEDPAEYDDPSDWPAWTDLDTWEPGPAVPPDAVVVPPEFDEWHPEPEAYEPSPDDQAEYERWLDRLDTLQQLHELDDACDRMATGWVGSGRLTDAGVAEAGLPVG